MPTDRLFRYSMCGIIFLFSLIFFYLFYDIGTISDLLCLFGDKGLVAFVGLFFTTPAVGLIISTFSFHILFLFWRKKVHYYVPEDRTIIDYVFKQFPELEDWMPSRNSKVWKNRTIDKFYPYYQIQVRRFIRNEAMDYIERRWSVYWTNTNTFSAIVAGFLVVTFYYYKYVHDVNPLQWGTIELYKWIGVGCLGMYCLSSYLLKRVAREHGKKFEHLALLKGIEQEGREIIEARRKDHRW